MIPMSARTDFVSPQSDDQRTMLVFPLMGNGTRQGLLFEDDGETHRWRDGQALWLRWELNCSAGRIDVTFHPEGAFVPAWRQLTVQLPPDEQRVLYINGERTTQYTLPSQR
jgi:alpha-glucosidase